MGKAKSATLAALGSIVVVAACGGASTSDFFTSPGASASDAAAASEGDAQQGGPPGASSSDAASDGRAPRDSSTPQKDQDVPDTVKAEASAPVEGIYCGVDSNDKRTFCDSATQNCCVRESGGELDFACKPKSGTGSSCSGIAVPCSDQVDCAGKICCASYDNIAGGYESVKCQDTCEVDSALTTEYRLCDPNAATDECEAIGQSCQASDAVDGWYICK